MKLELANKYINDYVLKNSIIKGSGFIPIKRKDLIKLINEARRDAIQEAAMILGETEVIKVGESIGITTKPKYTTLWDAQAAILKLKLEVQ